MCSTLVPALPAWTVIERNAGAFLFYEEGSPRPSGRAIEAVDRERLALADALGLRVLSEPDLGVLQEHMREANYSTGHSTAPGFLGIGAQSQLDNRYLTEDIGYSLVFLTDLAGRVSVKTPTMQAVHHHGVGRTGSGSPRRGGRTLATLGLDGMTASDITVL